MENISIKLDKRTRRFVRVQYDSTGGGDSFVSEGLRREDVSAHASGSSSDVGEAENDESGGIASTSARSAAKAASQAAIRTAMRPRWRCKSSFVSSSSFPASAVEGEKGRTSQMAAAAIGECSRCCCARIGIVIVNTIEK